MMDCYGKNYDSGDALCRACEIRSWCRTAGNKVDFYNVHGNIDQIPAPGDFLADMDGDTERESLFRERKFSYEDMLFVLRYLASLPPAVLKALSCAISDEGRVSKAKLSALAKQMKVSRQMVWKSLKQVYNEHPELQKVFVYRKRKKVKK